MAATTATRKPIDQITVADLVDFPIWEFCLDEEGVEGMDETWVRPLAPAAVPRWGLFALRGCRVRDCLGSPRRWLGRGDDDRRRSRDFASRAALRWKVSVRADKQDMRIDALREDDEKFRAAVADALGTSPVFPLRYRLSVLIEGEASHREGTVA